MKTKLLTLSLLLMGLSAGAQTVSVSISDDCSKNGKILKNGHECVDLGLSCLWATMNVGATVPDGCGSLFAWGETSTKGEYLWSTYKYCKGTATTMTKYCTTSEYGTVDNKTTLEAEDDAAHVNWGGTWRMPTDAEWTELRTQCTWEWTTQNDIDGFQITAKNGNSIFLPAAGYRVNTFLFDVGTYGYYRSSSLEELYSNETYYVSFYMMKGENHVTRLSDARYLGLSVRPVCSK